MKQYTTMSQWNELSEKAKTKLLDWYKEKNFEHPFGELEFLKFNSRWIPYLSIGQMIEFLMEKRGRHIWWYPFFSDSEYGTGLQEIFDGEFYDALWKEVKQILEQ